MTSSSGQICSVVHSTCHHAAPAAARAPEVTGLLALVLLTYARRDARRPGWPLWTRSGASPATAYLPATRADFLARLRRNDEARLAYQEALLLTENA